MPSAHGAHPLKAKLLARYERANSVALPILAAEACAAGLLIFRFIDWPYLMSNWIVSIVIVGLASYDSLLQYLMLVALKKKSVADLSDDVRIGYYTKSELLHLIRDVQVQLRLSAKDVNVFIIRDKSANASAVRMGFNPFIRSLNAIYINRSLLHILLPQELKAIVGHELGHNFRYQLLMRKYEVIHLVLAASVALFLLQIIGAGSGMALLIIFAALVPIKWASSAYSFSFSRVIEHLCDDFGARLTGMAPAVNGLLKIGSQAETQLHLQWKLVAMSMKDKTVTVKDAFTVLDRSMPFGSFDPEEVERDVKSLLRKKSADNQKISLKGFLSFLKDSGEETAQDELEDLGQELRDVKKRKKIDWTADYLSPGEKSLSENQIASLIDRLKTDADSVLFHLPGEIPGNVSTHPSFRDRVTALYQLHR